jgi:hypothetical protein
MQSEELKKKRSRLHTDEEKRKISEGNRGQISKLKDRNYEEIHGKEKGNLLRLHRSLKAKGKESRLKNRTYEDIHGAEKAEELKKQKASYSHITKPSTKIYACDKCGMKMGVGGKGLHIERCKGFKNFCLECGSIIWWYRQFCSVRCSMLFRTRSKDYLKMMSEVKKKSLRDHPETHPSVILAGTGRSKEVISDPQRRLYNIVKSLYNGNNVIFNHPVRTKSTVRYIDVALADRMILSLMVFIGTSSERRKTKLETKN